jgi:hypothetical protein
MVAAPGGESTPALLRRRRAREGPPG